MLLVGEIMVAPRPGRSPDADGTEAIPKSAAGHSAHRSPPHLTKNPPSGSPLRAYTPSGYGPLRPDSQLPASPANHAAQPRRGCFQARGCTWSARRRYVQTETHGGVGSADVATCMQGLPICA